MSPAGEAVLTVVVKAKSACLVWGTECAVLRGSIPVSRRNNLGSKLCAETKGESLL